MNAAPALQTKNLTVGYSSKKAGCPVLENLDLSVDPGELVCLLGPNGIGKSTLLRTLSKLQPALKGSIELDGVPLPALTNIDIARRLGVVLTERLEIGALSGRRVVELGRYPHLGWSGTLSSRDHEVVQWAIDAVDAGAFVARDANQLSDGERQRLMIARALAQEPVLLILDEPTAFLDVPSRVELMGLLRHLARDEDLAIVVSTHDLELGLRMADTIWLVMPDRRLHCGAPEDIIAEGLLDRAFQSDKIRFRPEERAFRFLSGARGRARVEGTGLDSVLTGAVLEREGFEIMNGLSAPAEVTVEVTSDPFRWCAHSNGESGNGARFAELASFLRKKG